MSGFTVNQPAQILAGAPGTAMLGPNTRVRGQMGYLGTQHDTLTFSNGATGRWMAPNVRTRSQGAFLVSQSSVGVATLSNGTTVTVQVVQGDPRIRSR